MILTKLYEQILDPSVRLTTSAIISDIGASEPVAAGAGAHNHTYVTTLAPYCSEPAGTKVLVRTSKNPIKNSKLEELKLSAQYALEMSDNNVGPWIYDIQYTSGGFACYVMEAFDMDLSVYMKTPRSNNIYQSLKMQTMHIIQQIAGMGVMCMDVKPKNSVVRTNLDGTVDLRFIDMDADFCNPSTMLQIGDNIQTETAYMYMMFLFANHLYCLDMNYLANENQRLKNVHEKDLRTAIRNSKEQFDEITHHYFPKMMKNVDTFIQFACSEKKPIKSILPPPSQNYNALLKNHIEQQKRDAAAAIAHRTVQAPFQMPSQMPNLHIYRQPLPPPSFQMPNNTNAYRLPLPPSFQMPKTYMRRPTQQPQQTQTQKTQTQKTQTQQTRTTTARRTPPPARVKRTATATATLAPPPPPPLPPLPQRMSRINSNTPDFDMLPM